MLYRNFIVNLISQLAITAYVNTATDNNHYVQQARTYLPIELSNPA